MTRHLAVDALEMAVARRDRDAVAGCVVHAERALGRLTPIEFETVNRAAHAD